MTKNVRVDWGDGTVAQTVVCPICHGDRTVTCGLDPEHSYERPCAYCAGTGYIWVEKQHGQ